MRGLKVDHVINVYEVTICELQSLSILYATRSLVYLLLVGSISLNMYWYFVWTHKKKRRNTMLKSLQKFIESHIFLKGRLHIKASKNEFSFIT